MKPAKSCSSGRARTSKRQQVDVVPGSTPSPATASPAAMHRALRLTIDRTAIQANWRWLQDRAGVPAGAAVKADGYGLGARETAAGPVPGRLPRLFRLDLGRSRGARAPCRSASNLVVLHGVGPDDVEAALRVGRAALPQHASSRSPAGRRSRPDRPCDVMVDTGHQPARPAADGNRRCSTGSRSTRCTAISPAPTRTAR